MTHSTREMAQNDKMTKDDMMAMFQAIYEGEMKKLERMPEEQRKKWEAMKYDCVLCLKPSHGYGHNPAPMKKKGKCCDACNYLKVLPCRMNLVK